MLRTRGLTANVTSTRLSSVVSYPAAQKAQLYWARSSVFRLLLAESTPAQLGHMTFHDISKMPRPTALSSAAMTRSSPIPSLAARSSALILIRARSGASRTNRSSIATTSSPVDARRVANKVSASLMQQSYMKDGNAKTRLARPRVTILRSQIRVIGDEDSCARRDVTHTRWTGRRGAPAPSLRAKRRRARGHEGEASLLV